jgi:hypothetical protein
VLLIGRPDIPQPGAYVHFHWTGMAMPMPYLSVPGYLLRLTAFNRLCFIHHGHEAAKAAMSYRDNGRVKVEPGVETVTHLNIVTNEILPACRSRADPAPIGHQHRFVASRKPRPRCAGAQTVNGDAFTVTTQSRLGAATRRRHRTSPNSSPPR